MNSADVVVGVIAGLNVQPKPRFNLVNGSVGISNARDNAGGALRTSSIARINLEIITRVSAAAGAGSQHEIVIAADGASLSRSTKP